MRQPGAGSRTQTIPLCTLIGTSGCETSGSGSKVRERDATRKQRCWRHVVGETRPSRMGCSLCRLPLFKLPSFRKSIHVWSWVPPIANRVKRRMIGCTGGLPRAPQLLWEGLHATTTSGPKVHRPSSMETWRARSQAAGSVIDVQPGAADAPAAPTILCHGGSLVSCLA